MTIDKIIVVCNDDDGSVADICQEESVGISQYKPPKRNLLSEFWHANLWDDNDLIVRITADCPLLESQEIDSVVKSHIEKCADYSYNRCDDTENQEQGEGRDVEVFTGRALKTAYETATNDYDKEHCTPFFRKGDFLVNKTPTPKGIGLSLNTKEDYSKILEIINGYT